MWSVNSFDNWLTTRNKLKHELILDLRLCLTDPSHNNHLELLRVSNNWLWMAESVEIVVFQEILRVGGGVGQDRVTLTQSTLIFHQIGFK